MTALLSEPVRLTRASLIGLTFRLGKVYGATPIGIRIYLAYHEAKGCRDSILRRSLELATAKGLDGFQNVRGESCSWRYYERLTLSGRERERRECEARKTRALELYEANERRAS